jgi:hypothetical protein
MLTQGKGPIMAKKNSDLFDRLRQAGLRREAAKALSQATENAGKKAERTARAAVKELRALADEIERRLPGAAPAADATARKPAPARRPRTTTARAAKPSTAAKRSTAPAKPRATRTTTRPRAASRPPVPPAPEVSPAEGDAPTADA